MAGYNGYSMSNRAVQAYADGEQPISKWTKAEMLHAISEIRQDIDFSKLTKAELQKKLLFKSSWHHTSMHYNETDFYSIDVEAVENMTNEAIKEIISFRKPRVKKTNEEKEAELHGKAIRAYERVAKRCSQNPYFFNDTSIASLTVNQIEKATSIIEELEAGYRNAKTKYKTVRGYIVNEIKKIKL